MKSISKEYVEKVKEKMSIIQPMPGMLVIFQNLRIRKVIDLFRSIFSNQNMFCCYIENLASLMALDVNQI